MSTGSEAGERTIGVSDVDGVALLGGGVIDVDALLVSDEDTGQFVVPEERDAVGVNAIGLEFGLGG